MPLTRTVAAMLLALPALALAPGGASGMRADGGSGAALPPADAAWHIVLLEEPALASYRGGVPGLAPTSAEALGERRLDAGGAAGRDYLRHLGRHQDGALRRMEALLGRPMPTGDRYTHAVDGFSLRLARSEAGRLRAMPGVALVQASARRLPATDAGPAWGGAEPLWSGQATGLAARGEGIVVGVIDTGINIDHPSFAEVDGQGYEHANPRSHFLGWCDPASPRHDPALACNAKLIGLWSHDSVHGMRPAAHPEDEDGHGTHTASTAAGNALTARFGHSGRHERAISGFAPRANVAAYDVCDDWGCPDIATVAAIEQATRDGVDVLNFSITTFEPRASDESLSPWRNAINLAFLGAREAGIVVSVAAGNFGPAPSSLSSNAPWTLTVANASHNRSGVNGLVELGGGEGAPPDLAGRAFSGDYGPAPVTLARGRLDVDGRPDDGLCAKPFPPGTWSGEIVLCDRGVVPRVAKGVNVLLGGAGGFVLANTDAEGESLAADDHALPATHVGAAAGALLRDWLAAGGEHRGRILATRIDLDPSNGDVLNLSSSRGPAMVAACCRRPGLPIPRLTDLAILKPDLTAPGTDILAAIADDPASPAGEAPFGLMTGSSMASPHAAGAAALLAQARPLWTPGQIQSALAMAARSGTVRDPDRARAADPLGAGAGRLDAARAAMAGLTMDETAAALRAADPGEGGQPADLNLPSLVAPACVAGCAWQRRVAGAGEGPASWTAFVEAAPGWALTVAPERFRLAPGQEQRLAVRAIAAGAAPGAWAFGRVVLRPDAGGPGELALPVAIRAAAVQAPPYLRLPSAGPSGAARWPLRAAAPLDLVLTGLPLVSPVVERFRVPEAGGPDPFTDRVGTWRRSLDIPGGAARLVAEVVDAGAPDVDLWIGRDANGDGRPQASEQACQSLSPGRQEYCEVLLPEAGPWWILAQNARGSGGQDDVRLDWAVVPLAASGDLRVAWPPPTGASGHAFEVAMSWTAPGLAAGERRYSAVGFGEDPAEPAGLGLMPVDLVGVDAIATPTPDATPTPPRLWLPSLGRRP